jgi:hypothetical protein
MKIWQGNDYRGKNAWMFLLIKVSRNNSAKKACGRLF